MNVSVERRKRDPRTPFEPSVTWGYGSDGCVMCRKETKEEGKEGGVPPGQTRDAKHCGGRSLFTLAIDMHLSPQIYIARGEGMDINHRPRPCRVCAEC